LRWLGVEVVLGVHTRQIAEHGGPSGVRDRALLESALARPRHLAAYGDPDPCDLAAAYAEGIVRNHPFVDGNKRTAWVAARLFLADNGYRLRFDPEKAVRIMLSLAAGEIDAAAFAAWLRSNTQATPT
jgi:death-on-curing protein